MKGYRTRLACLVLALVAAGCGGAGEESAATPAPAGETESRSQRRVPVETRVLAPKLFRDTLEMTALLEAWDEVALATEFGGYVREVNFEKGRRVEKGALLARIGDDLAAARLDQARADQMAAEANFLKVSKLVERQALPKQDLVAATSRRDNAAALVREMEIRLERAMLRSPVSGVALDRPVEPGEVLAPGQRVTTLQRVDRLKAAARVPDTEIGWLGLGREARVTLDAFPGRHFDAALSFVAPAADPDTRTFLVEFTLRDGRSALRPGMVGTLELLRRVVEDAVVVPTDALVARQEGFVAFVVEDCRAGLREVEIGATEADEVLVESGLALGEELVVAGQSDLVPGQPVRSESCP